MYDRYSEAIVEEAAITPGAELLPAAVGVAAMGVASLPKPLKMLSEGLLCSSSVKSMLESVSRESRKFVKSASVSNADTSGSGGFSEIYVH